MTGERPVIVLGAGGHAKVVIDALKAAGADILGITDPDQGTHGQDILGVQVLGDDDMVKEHGPDAVVLVNGVGSINVSDRRKDIFGRFKDGGYTFIPVIHPSAVIGGDVEIADAVQIMAGAVVQPGCRIGVNAIINTRASVDHDCVIGDHVHIAPGAVLGGGITVGDGSHIGTASSVIQNVRIGENVLVAAGAAVVTDFPDGARIAGVPATSIAE